jgi:S-adenosylmethionine decarboxylase
MAFHDTLFQLGMDLTRSSTAQKEDYSCVECDVDVERGASAEASPNSRTPSGTLHTIELLSAPRLNGVGVERALKRAGEALGLKPRLLRAAGAAEAVVAVAGGTLSARVGQSDRAASVTIDMQGVAGVTPAAAMIALAGAFGAREAVLRKACIAPVRMVVPVAKTLKRSIERDGATAARAA